MYGHLMRTRFTLEQVAAVAAVLEIDLEDELFTLDDLRRGMDVELEHGSRDPTDERHQRRPRPDGEDRAGPPAGDARLLRAP